MNQEQFLKLFNRKFNDKGGWQKTINIDNDWAIFTGVDENAFGGVIDLDNEPFIFVRPDAQRNGIGLFLLEQYLGKKATQNIYSIHYTALSNESLKLLNKFARIHKDSYTVFKKNTGINDYAIVLNNDISALLFAQIFNLQKLED